MPTCRCREPIPRWVLGCHPVQPPFSYGETEAPGGRPQDHSEQGWVSLAPPLSPPPHPRHPSRAHLRPSCPCFHTSLGTARGHFLGGSGPGAPPLPFRPIGAPDGSRRLCTVSVPRGLQPRGSLRSSLGSWVPGQRTAGSHPSALTKPTLPGVSWVRFGGRRPFSASRPPP